MDRRPLLRHRSNLPHRYSQPPSSVCITHGWLTTFSSIALGAGGMWGFIEALQKPRANLLAHSMLNPQTAATLDSASRSAAGNPTMAGAAAAGAATRQSGKLVLNNILNHVTRRGPFLGNSAGVLAMTYNLISA